LRGRFNMDHYRQVRQCLRFGLRILD
jgi:hypothetical protein